MSVKVIKTRKGEMPMQETNDYSFSQELGREQGLINVYPNIEYQEIKGFGGAFTEAAADTLNDKIDIHASYY